MLNPETPSHALCTTKVQTQHPRTFASWQSGLKADFHISTLQVYTSSPTLSALTCMAPLHCRRMKPSSSFCSMLKPSLLLL